MKELIINSPSMQNLREKYLSTLLTFVFWMVWIFLWTPLVTLAGWLLGVDWVYFQMIELNGYQSVVEDFILFLACIAVMGGALAIWAGYNFLRFRNVERRMPLPPTENQQLANFFKVDAATLSRHQQSQCFSVSFDDKGNIIYCTELDPGSHSIKLPH